MVQRLLLLGVVGSGLALNATGLSHFNTSEMSSIFDTGTGSAGKDNTGEGSTDGGPFNVKAMVKNLFNAGNHLLVPMEVQTNRRMQRILRHIMAEVREDMAPQRRREGCCSCPFSVYNIPENECERMKDCTVCKDVEDEKARKAKEKADRLKEKLDKANAEADKDWAEYLDKEEAKKARKAQSQQTINELQKDLEDSKKKITGIIKDTKNDKTGKALKALETLRNMTGSELEDIRKISTEVEKISTKVEPKKQILQRPGGCIKPDAGVPSVLAEFTSPIEERIDALDKLKGAMDKSIERTALLKWLAESHRKYEKPVAYTVNKWCGTFGNRGRLIKQPGEELVEYWQCRICKGVASGASGCNTNFKNIFFECKGLLPKN